MGLASTAVIVLAAALLPSLAAAQGRPPANDDCQACHAEPSMARADGRPVVVPPPVFGASIHSGLACVDCHADLATLSEFPHPDRLAPVACATCHEEPATRLAASSHARLPGDGGRPAACVDCHGPPHAIKPASDLEAPTHKLHVAATCGRCHSDTAPALTRGPSVAAAFGDSIHGQALSRAGLVVAPTCTDCHRSHDVTSPRVASSPVHPRNVPATCGTCHAGIEHQYRDGVHGELLTAGRGDAPQCATCHTAHQIVPPAGSEWQISAVQECGTCHAEALATYRDTLHGQVTGLGFTPVAKCADCHQPHAVFRVTDARSTVAPANLVTTCRRCHTGASESFARYQPHANRDDRQRYPVLYYASRFMTGLFVAVFTFFGLHSALWFAREHTGDSGEARRDG